MKDLVDTWIKVELVHNEKSLAEALRDMNKALKTKTTHSRVREWQKRVKGRGNKLPSTLRFYMLKTVLPYLYENSLSYSPTKKEFDELARKLR